MAAFPAGALISAGASLIGGAFGRKSRSDEVKFQRQQAKNKISWTVEDAKRAGIHPLAALGSPAAGSFAAPVGGSPMGDAVGDAGAAIGRAISPMMRERHAAEMSVLRSEAARNTAEAEAVSRTAIQKVRRATQNIPSDIIESDNKGKRMSLGPGGVVLVPPGVSQQKLEDEIGEAAEVYGFGRAMEMLAQKWKKEGLWPGVLGF